MQAAEVVSLSSRVGSARVPLFQVRICLHLYGSARRRCAMLPVLSGWLLSGLPCWLPVDVSQKKAAFRFSHRSLKSIFVNLLGWMKNAESRSEKKNEASIQLNSPFFGGWAWKEIGTRKSQKLDFGCQRGKRRKVKPRSKENSFQENCLSGSFGALLGSDEHLTCNRMLKNISEL